MKSLSQTAAINGVAKMQKSDITREAAAAIAFCEISAVPRLLN
jgi:hypothetical protein